MSKPVRETTPTSTADRRGLRARRSRFAVVGGAALVAATFAMGGVAAAAIQPFRVSPSSGPVGTVVHVSGTDCSPGTSLSGQDFVKISSTTLPLTLDLPVAANGSWSGSFAVPDNSLPLPGLVLAACFTDGLPSASTIYSPQSFTVTGANSSTPTTMPRTGGTQGPGAGGVAPGGTPTTRPTAGGSGPGNTGSGSGVGSGGSSAGPSGSNGTGAGGSNLASPNGNGSGSGIGAGTAGAKSALASAARAQKSKLASLSTGTHKHFPWLWLLLLLLAVAAVGSLLMWRRHRDHTEVTPIPVATP